MSTPGVRRKKTQNELNDKGAAAQNDMQEVQPRLTLDPALSPAAGLH